MALCGKITHKHARVPITTDMIHEATAKLQWNVLVWACRNGVPFDYKRMPQLLRQNNPHPACSCTEATLQGYLMGGQAYYTHIVASLYTIHVKIKQALGKLTVGKEVNISLCFCEQYIQSSSCSYYYLNYYYHL